jgi:hypothetical protein
LPRLLVEVLPRRPGPSANQRPFGLVALYNIQILFGPELPGWHSPGLLDEVLVSGPGRCANRMLPGRVSLYNFQVLFKLELYGLTFAKAPGRSASEAAGPKCKPGASRTDSNLQQSFSTRFGTLRNPPDRHSPGLLIEVLPSRPGRSANQRTPGQVALYNFHVLFGPELPGFAFARAPGRSARQYYCLEVFGPVESRNTNSSGAQQNPPSHTYLVSFLHQSCSLRDLFNVSGFQRVLDIATVSKCPGLFEPQCIYIYKDREGGEV